MKTWLTKWRISRALDECKPLPPAAKRALAESAELRHFAANAAAVDQSLASTRPTPAAPPALHESIMRAVRSAKYAEDSARQQFWPGLIPASALTFLILLSVFGVQRFARPPAAVLPAPAASPLAVAHAALASGGDWIQAVPAAALSPLSEEMTRLNRDLTNAQNYLLASLP